MLYFKITIYGQIKLPVLAKIFIAIRPQTFPLFGHTIIEKLQLSIFFYLPVPTFRQQQLSLHLDHMHFVKTAFPVF